jgi:signal transduction histidine kinase
VEQQASLRRLGAVVAAGAASADVFAAIAREVAHVLRPRLVQIFRWERDGSVTVVGVITASWEERRLPLVDWEERLAHFAQLLGTAIANADSRDQLTASRARVLTAGDEARRRVVRDLHDGAQQRLVQTMLTLKLARQTVREDPAEAESLIAEALDGAEQSNAELRELAHGLLPAVLTHGGLRAGVAAVVSRLDLPVDTDVTITRLPPERALHIDSPHRGGTVVQAELPLRS